MLGARKPVPFAAEPAALGVPIVLLASPILGLVLGVCNRPAAGVCCMLGPNVLLCALLGLGRSGLVGLAKLSLLTGGFNEVGLCVLVPGPILWLKLGFCNRGVGLVALGVPVLACTGLPCTLEVRRLVVLLCVLVEDELLSLFSALSTGRKIPPPGTAVLK